MRTTVARIFFTHTEIPQEVDLSHLDDKGAREWCKDAIKNGIEVPQTDGGPGRVNFCYEPARKISSIDLITP